MQYYQSIYAIVSVGMKQVKPKEKWRLRLVHCLDISSVNEWQRLSESPLKRSEAMIA